MKSVLQNWKKWHMTQILILFVLIMVLGFFTVLHAFANNVDISALKLEVPQATVFYDKNGKVASKITANRNEGVSIKQVPLNMQHAVVAIEDRRFYEHHGIDFIGIARALFRNLQAGGTVEGGSTITQQLAKNVFLNPKKTYKRKLDEIFIARKIEKKYTKPEIMQMYLNQIYFGDGAWGIKKAAQKYFGKDVKDLSLSESAMLAGLIKAPSALNPYNHLEKAKERRDVVLAAMKEQGFITDQQLKRAKTEQIVLQDKGGDPFRGKYPYYVDQVLEEAIEKYGLSQDDLLTGGYKIYTELDQTMQTAAEKTYQNDTLFPKGSDRLVQSGAVLEDPVTGGIRAIIGGRGEHTFRGYNRASQLKAQPGSSLKPIAVYTPALEEGWKMTDMLTDEPMKFGDYEPSNYNHQYAGEVPMYQAVMESKNVPAVWLLNEIGLEKGLDSSKRFGIPLEKGDRNLSLALGGLEKGVSPVNMAEAFAVFPNHGIRVESHVIRKILDADGTVVAQWKVKKQRVTTKSVTDEMTAMLLGVVKYGTGKGAQIPGREVAGKTGSTQVPISGINGVKDQWFVGYTPQLVGAVWLGYDKTDEKHYLTTTSSEGAAIVFRELMAEALTNTAPERFNVPSIDQLMEQQKQEEAAPNPNSFQGQINNELKKWQDEWKKQKEKWQKKWKEKENGKGRKHEGENDD
ncbi:transglycosylase domain-containing protein [Neobacillus sp. SM06]|uniref:transglycosylase domain-containing protein n=1 Tax=Neobacillus sp. SM06 TaxID=3422492 RepID=UPI003D275F52